MQFSFVTSLMPHAKKKFQHGMGTSLYTYHEVSNNKGRKTISSSLDSTFLFPTFVVGIP